MIICAQKYPTIQEVTTEIKPGNIKLWFSSYLPIFVLPDQSKFMEAMSLGWFSSGNNK